MNLFVLNTWLETKFAKEERGASMVEYILLVALIALAVIAAVVFLKDQVNNKFNDAGRSCRAPAADPAPPSQSGDGKRTTPSSDGVVSLSQPVACIDGSFAPLATGVRPAPGRVAERSGPRRQEISAWINRPREHGDIKENADYDAAKNEQGHNEARVRQLEELLRSAEVVAGGSGEVVAPGTIVEVKMEGDDATTSYLVGSIEERSDEFEVLSTSSPLGQALLEHSPGDTVGSRGSQAHVRGRDRERPARRLISRPRSR